MALTQDGELPNTIQAGSKYIENESLQSTFTGLFSEINLGSDKLGKTYADRNAKLCTIITKIAEGLAEFSMDREVPGTGDAHAIGRVVRATAGFRVGTYSIRKAAASMAGLSPQGRCRHDLGHCCPGARYAHSASMIAAGSGRSLAAGADKRLRLRMNRRDGSAACCLEKAPFGGWTFLRGAGP